MKLLISPFSIEEAKIAIKGAVDIIDVKNPNEGSLGANFPWVINHIRRLVHENGHQEISATIGDIPNLPGTASLAALGAANCNVDYIKVGLKGPQTQEDAITLMKMVSRAVKDYKDSIKVVAAGYADFERFQTLSPLMLPKIARLTDTDVVMIDTGIKDGRSLFDFLSRAELQGFLDHAREVGIQTALAGSLKPSHIPSLRELNPSIIGIRGAVCEGYDRLKGKMQLSKINEFKTKIKSNC